MNLIVIHDQSSGQHNGSLLQAALRTETIAEILLQGLVGAYSVLTQTKLVRLAIPQAWAGHPCPTEPRITYYSQNLQLNLSELAPGRTNQWLVISNGSLVTKLDYKWLAQVLASFNADLIAVNVEPQLMAFREKVRVTSSGTIAGFRRLYADSAHPSPLGRDWPCHLFLKVNSLERILVETSLPLSFHELVARANERALTVQGLTIAGSIFDLQTEHGLLSFLTHQLENASSKSPAMKKRNHTAGQAATPHAIVSPSARLFGNIICGRNVSVGSEAIVVGPAILADNVTLEPAAVVKAAVIGANITIPADRLVKNRILLDPLHDPGTSTSANAKTSNGTAYRRLLTFALPPRNDPFRHWPTFSYPRFLKRIADIVAATIALILFAPVLPILSLAVKLSSPGPVFFKDKRQGLHAKEFYCLKFRTMMQGAHQIQDRLRGKSQVDGPQFKIADDPRVNLVGRFLRDTCIDEIPQFLNVLLGQMSIVGPRPSPQFENSLCPPWRDARLSVRPGITGLWQVARTRSAGQDFQEWLHYDNLYVANLSLLLDLRICWKTVKMLTKKFFDQF